ncbi:hypothetical protein AURDEDRAFT_174275 [Auricularia subglabra TFB-10046 SS5]|uniref:Endonuclease/exonuclease/phosphatase domain-containing protein n=1 Tax=Auricularia subglabra (strain TFB-10046 / SS5) TaxID=717982 RepID=J0D9U8_AURST|nr:hypothetical protein AURDEDRAFT_174275 [Auricularia subglabra TFB-10046 SS5]
MDSSQRSICQHRQPVQSECVRLNQTLQALPLLVAGVPTALSPTSGSFTALSTTPSPASIGTKFAVARHGIIHVREDRFENDAFRTPTSGGVPFRSSLKTLSNFDWVDFMRVKWNTCPNATTKGFTSMRVNVDGGVWVDVYNLHADAGTEADDQRARTNNIQQVSNYIATWSAGIAVLVFGNGLADAWVALVHGGTPPSAESRAARPARVSFLQPNGSILSDHDPVLVSFAWTLPSALRASNIFGGRHGSSFSDIPGLQAAPRGATLTLQA